MRSLRTVLAALATALVAGAVVGATMLAPAAAGGLPANKMAVDGSVIEAAAPGETLEILSGVMKTSNPTDLVISVSLECSILTQVTTVGNDDASAFGRVEVWVEIDGVPVGVTSEDDGRVVFCDRAQRQTTSLFDDEDATITSYLKTRSAHSFSWIDLNLGSATHTIVVKAHFTEEASSNAVAQALIGKRTLVVEPVKLAQEVVV